MKKKCKKILSVFLTAALILSVLTVTSFANESEPDPLPFDLTILDQAFSRAPAGFYLLASNNASYFGVDQSIPGAPKWAVGEWGETAPRNAGEAFQYLAAVCIVAPDYVGAQGYTVEERVLQHLRCFIAGGNEWGASGTGLSAQGYVAPVIAMATVRTKLPNVWSQLTDEEKAKVDLLMAATLVGSHYASADANYDYLDEAGNQIGLGRAPILYRDNPYNATTGVDQTGNYERGWNINHRIGILAAIASYYYFGPAAEAEGLTRAEYCNRLLANFVYDDFMSALEDAGFTNVYTVFGNAGNETDPDHIAYDVALERRTRSSSVYSPGGEFHYFGTPLSEIGGWFEEFILGSMYGPVRPYGGDSRFPSLEPTLLRPYGYPGNSNTSGDNLLNFPNLGAPGMQMEFDTTDGGREDGNDHYSVQSAAGARSSLSYVSEGIPYTLTAFNMLNLYDSVDSTGMIAGIRADAYADMLAMANAGLEDYLYKNKTGYASYAHSNRGNMGSGSANPPDRVRYQLDLWVNVVDRPLIQMNAVNTAGTVSAMRAALEDQGLALILYQYNGLSEAGKDAAAAAMIQAAQAKPYTIKKDMQAALELAVWDAAVNDFNELILSSETTPQDVVNALSVNLTTPRHSEELGEEAFVPNDGKPNALGIFVYGFTDFYVYSTETGRQRQLKVAAYILENAPDGGFADRRAIRDMIILALDEVADVMTVNVSVFPEGAGTVTGGGTYKDNSTATVTVRDNYDLVATFVAVPDVEIRNTASTQVWLQNGSAAAGTGDPGKAINGSTFVMEQNNNGASSRHSRVFFKYDLPTEVELADILADAPAGFAWNVTANLVKTSTGAFTAYVYGIPDTWDPNELTYPNQSQILPGVFTNNAPNLQQIDPVKPLGVSALPSDANSSAGINVTDYIMSLISSGETVASLLFAPPQQPTVYPISQASRTFAGIGNANEALRPSLTFSLVWAGVSPELVEAYETALAALVAFTERDFGAYTSESVTAALDIVNDALLKQVDMYTVTLADLLDVIAALEAALSEAEQVLEPISITIVTPTAWVEKINGSQNRLFITVTVTYYDGSEELLEWNGLIDNNTSGTYQVGSYNVYVDVKGNTQIRALYIVQ